MSSYLKLTQRPDSKQVENAEWLDDFFGQHNYGVRFPSDGKVFRADEYEWLDDKKHHCGVPRHIEGALRTVAETDKGKRFDFTEHEDGRKDVTVHLNKLDIVPKDAEEAHVKQVIEDAVLPRMEAAMVHVVVVHKPSNKSASKAVPLPQVRAYAEACVKAFNEGRESPAPDSAFCIVEVHHDTFLTRVTSL